MLQEIFCNDVCEIIRKMLQVDFTEYKLWCYDEGMWVYCWTENVNHNFKLTKILKCPLKCPNGKTHKIYENFINITNYMEANGRILIIEDVNSFNRGVKRGVNFNIIKI